MRAPCGPLWPMGPSGPIWAHVGPTLIESWANAAPMGLPCVPNGVPTSFMSMWGTKRPMGPYGNPYGGALWAPGMGGPWGPMGPQWWDPLGPLGGPMRPTGPMRPLGTAMMPTGPNGGTLWGPLVDHEAVWWDPLGPQGWDLWGPWCTMCACV
jgi:hypothetical protein